jgi:hypothetical protein
MVEPQRRKGGKKDEGKDCGATLAIAFGRKCTQINADSCGALLAMVETRRRKGTVSAKMKKGHSALLAMSRAEFIDISL